jgi:hypothetical protein
VTPAVTAAGGRADAYVSRVRASAHAAGRAYVAKNGYKFDDFRPYLYRTDDYGETWRSITSNLPTEPINVIVEDVKNPALLFVGNDSGVFVSIDGGGHWVRMNNNVPNVPVHDMLIHPRENDLILGTYGRDLWITNIGPLEEIDVPLLQKDAHLFRIQDTVQRVTWQFAANDYLFGQRHLQTPNDAPGMVIRYYLRQPLGEPPTVVVTDGSGKEWMRVQGRNAAGINSVVWTMRPQGAGRGGRGNAVEQLAPLGEYTVTLDSGSTKLTGKARVTKTQGWSLAPSPQVIR